MVVFKRQRVVDLIFTVGIVLISYFGWSSRLIVAVEKFKRKVLATNMWRCKLQE